MTPAVEWTCGVCNNKHGARGDEISAAMVTRLKRLWTSGCLRAKIGDAAYDYLFEVGLIPSDAGKGDKS